jgi:hypothetical protein
MAPDIRQHCHEGPAVSKKPFVSGAEIVQTGFTLRRCADAIFRTASVAHIQNRAAEALPGQCLLLGQTEIPLLGAFEHSGKRCLTDVAQMMLRPSEMVTAVNVTIVLQNRHAAARPLKNAQGVLQSKSRSRRFFKNLHFNASDVAIQPKVKNCA